MDFLHSAVCKVQRKITGKSVNYEGYPENKFRLRILPLQRCGHDGAQAFRVFGFFVKARTQFADI